MVLLDKRIWKTMQKGMRVYGVGCFSVIPFSPSPFKIKNKNLYTLSVNLLNLQQSGMLIASLKINPKTTARILA